MSCGLQISSIVLSFSALFSLTSIALARNLLNSSNDTDWHALLSIRYQIGSDPNGLLSSWNSSLHFCNWQGVICNITNQRVNALNLSGMELGGTLSPYIGNLTFLKELKLESNFFHGTIPQEIGRLYHLQHFSLHNNSFQGEIPRNLTHCSHLRVINLDRNHLEEFAMGGPASTLVDVYSYGIVLLEMFSGKRPTDNMFIDDFCLHNYVKMAIPDQVLRVTDPRLLSEAENVSHRTAGQARKHTSHIIEKCLALIFRIGLTCSAYLPRERMDIADALMGLRAIRDLLLEEDETAILIQG